MQDENDLQMPFPMMIAADTLWLFLLLAFLFIAFTYLFAFKWRLTEISWKRVDYWWLGAAAFGLILQAQQIRIEWFSSIYTLKTFNTDQSLRELKSTALGMTDDKICLVKGFVSPVTTVAAELANACTEFESFKPRDARSTSVYEFGMFRAIDKLSDYKSRYTEPTIIKKLDDIEKKYKTWEHDTEHANKVYKKTELTEHEKIYKMLSPLFFVLALALRLSKVFGENRLKTHPPEKTKTPEFLLTPKEFATKAELSAMQETLKIKMAEVEKQNIESADKIRSAQLLITLALILSLSVVVYALAIKAPFG